MVVGVQLGRVVWFLRNSLALIKGLAILVSVDEPVYFIGHCMRQPFYS